MGNDMLLTFIFSALGPYGHNGQLLSREVLFQETDAPSAIS